MTAEIVLQLIMIAWGIIFGCYLWIDELKTK